MTQGIETIVIERPLLNVEALDTCDETPAETTDQERSGDSTATACLNSADQKKEILRLCSILKAVVDKVNIFYEKLYSGHKEAIAALSVEIARKILIREINEGDYKIEEIIKQALAKVPTRNEMVIHLNPKDYCQIQKLEQQQTEQAADLFKEIKFIANANVGPAECLIETPKGIIKSIIDQQLERIASALESAE